MKYIDTCIYLYEYEDTIWQYMVCINVLDLRAPPVCKYASPSVGSATDPALKVLPFS